jgi:uncharacterized protein (UPF0335 family)
MQSLPTPVTTENLNQILATIEALPSAEITRHADVVTVHATKRATGDRVKVLRAITSDGDYWHVMAVAGIVSAKFTVDA